MSQQLSGCRRVYKLTLTEYILWLGNKRRNAQYQHMKDLHGNERLKAQSSHEYPSYGNK